MDNLKHILIKAQQAFFFLSSSEIKEKHADPVRIISLQSSSFFFLCFFFNSQTIKDVLMFPSDSELLQQRIGNYAI